ncbi:MAG: branched-chain amino acid aminotransferase [Oscillospiraceae bacterium]|nr:branched-chain amino acid aminotransferase [Oscillospiraceae bacterium]MDD6503536.1 branched-chain amino acid aminotransferase [Oscillospiraceae bacterium]MDY4104047.1 branched-chain amino acid aminotransferase [Oscillospiraceae bacterium]
MEIKITKTATPKTKPAVKGLPFGKEFTDHMFLMDYDEGIGWHDPRIVPYAPISLELGAVVFHYGQEIFEGMKAYRTAEGKVQMFRPIENIRRMNTTADRLCVPRIPEEDFMQALKELLIVEQDWVPAEEGTSLYIRPLTIATESQLGVHASNKYLFAIICCVVDKYYKEGLNPVKIMVENHDVRAVRGGTGFTKCGANYAISLRAGEVAAQKGFSQVLWLDGVYQKYVEEVGSMNVMFKIDGKIVTPELDGSILPGVTRKSCIELLKSWGMEVEERMLSIDELIEAAESGKLEEAWGTGTAAVISPIGELFYNDKGYFIADNKIGPVSQKLYDTLTGIQWGTAPDTFGWVEPVC